MLTILNYTSYEEIRAVTGLSEDELPDSELALQIYSNALELAFDSLTLEDETKNPIKTVFDTLDPDTDSAIWAQTRLFATYFVALEVVVSLSMKAPKSLSDSKVTITRWSDTSTWNATIVNIRAKLSQIRIDLVGKTIAAPSLLTAVKPDYDPVTG